MAERLAFRLPASLIAEREGAVAILRLNRPQKRNALNDEAIVGIEQFFSSLPDGIGAVLIAGEGEHFSAGLDLSELEERDVTQGIAHSNLWHRAFEKIQFGKVPAVAVLHGGWSAAVLSLPPRCTCASPSGQPITRCPKAAVESTLAVAVRFDCHG